MSLSFQPIDRDAFRDKLIEAAVQSMVQKTRGPTSAAEERRQIEAQCIELGKYGKQPDLLDQALEALTYGWFNPRMEQDMSGVVFNRENVLTAYDDMPRMKNFRGIHERPGGLVFYGLEAGGDWEWPVAFILYFDGTEFRGYIPKSGNAYNTKTMTAYGSEDESLVCEDQEPDEDAGDLPVRKQAKVPVMLADIDAAFGLAAPLAPAVSSTDCKTLLETDANILAAGFKGPWKRLSKTGNAQEGIVRTFQGKTGFVRVIEKDQALSIEKMAATREGLDAPAAGGPKP